MSTVFIVAILNSLNHIISEFILIYPEFFVVSFERLWKNFDIASILPYNRISLIFVLFKSVSNKFNTTSFRSLVFVENTSCDIFMFSFSV